MRTQYVGHRALMALGLAATVTVGGCSRNPATGGRQFSLISEAQEIQMGREYDQQVVASIGLYDNAALQQYVQQVGSRLSARSERPNLPWTFRVVDDAAVNAFALPGGFIYVTRGIMAHMENEAQLASVLGHEIGHVTARHQVGRMSSQQLAQLGLAVGSILSPTVERYAGIASAGMQVLFLKYSRDDESQADDLGLRYMTRGTYDARRMPEIFTMLDRVSEASGGGGRLPEWLATHPNPSNRRERMERAVAALPRDSVGTVVNEDSYLRHLDGMVFGDDPRQGFFSGAAFYHPEMRFKLDFPSGWQTQNTKQAVAAVSSQQDALLQLALAGESSAEAAARAFFSQEGVQGAQVQRVTVSGLTAYAGPFAAQTEQGVLRGTAMFVEHGGHVFALLGYGPEARWSARQAEVERAMASFGPLTDPTALNVQPLRLDIVRVDRGSTLQEMAQSRPSAVSVTSLALINQVQPGTGLAAGKNVKWVTGTPLTVTRRQR